MVEQYRVEDDAPWAEREGAGRAGRALEAAVVDPRAMPGDAPEPRGEDVVQHAEALERAHGGQAHEMGRHSVARELVAVDDEHPAALAGEQLGDACARGASADDQHVV